VYCLRIYGFMSIFCLLFITGCSGSTTAKSATATTIPTATDVVSSSELLTRCGLPNQASGIVVGDIVFAAQQSSGSYTYQLTDPPPPNQPLKLKGDGLSPSSFDGNYTIVDLNPNGDKGDVILITFCNTGSQNHPINDITISLSHFTPETQTFAIWSVCNPDQNWYIVPDGTVNGPSSCPASSLPSSNYHSANLSFTASDSPSTKKNLNLDYPISISPTQVSNTSSPPSSNAYVVGTGITLLQHGTYQFTVSFVDNDGKSHTIPHALSVHTAATRVYDGEFCQTNTMKAQIPSPTNGKAYYICQKP
jgi:hypothetical protein